MAVHNAVPKICLLLGVPADHASFLSRVVVSDWLSKFNPPFDGPERDRVLEDRWASEYCPLVAEPLLELTQQAKEQGIDVRTDINLQEFSCVTRTHELIILFAHWKSYELVPEDLIHPANIAAFIDRVRSDSTEAGQWLLIQLQQVKKYKDGEGRRNWWSFKQRAEEQRGLAEVLSDAIDVYSATKNLPNQDHVDLVFESKLTRRSRARDYLDQTFRGLIRPGNRLELFDGLHSKEDIEKALWSEFTGILDLTTCTSTVLADYIATTRKQKLRTVQFEAVQELLWHAKCIGIALSLLLDYGIPYQQGRLTAAETVTQAVSDKGMES